MGKFICLDFILYINNQTGYVSRYLERICDFCTSIITQDMGVGILNGYVTLIITQDMGVGNLNGSVT